MMVLDNTCHFSIVGIASECGCFFQLPVYLRVPPQTAMSPGQFSGVHHSLSVCPWSGSHLLLQPGFCPLIEQKGELFFYSMFSTTMRHVHKKIHFSSPVPNPPKYGQIRSRDKQMSTCDFRWASVKS